MPVRRLSVTEAMNLYSSALTLLPGVSSVHAGFDGDAPVVIVTVSAYTIELEQMIVHTVRGADVRIIPVGSRISISAREALCKYGAAVMEIDSVTSVGIARISSANVMMVRCYPLSDNTRSTVLSNFPDAPIQFRESRHKKNCVASIFEFCLKMIKAPILLLLVSAVVFFVLQPIFYEIKDIKPQLGAETAEGTVISAGRPYENTNTKGIVVQPVAVRFNDRGRELVFTEAVSIAPSIYYKINKSIPLYRDGGRISISYYTKDPLGTAKVYDVRPPPDPTLFNIATFFIVGLILFFIWRRWQEW